MSVDFEAFFDVTVEAVTLEWLLARIEEMPVVFAPFVESYRRRFRTEKWELRPCVAGLFVERNRHLFPNEKGALPLQTLDGPGGFSLSIYGRALRLYHGVHFRVFTGDAWHRETLRRICFTLARLVGSGRAIYMHELMPTAGDDGLSQIESGLRARIGPPAETFEELHAAEFFAPRAWYIDTFADMLEGGG